ncbi:predicted protein [Nematostella vectensis]|uniref:GATA-type domain-containing protein n=1 Tax=Nematostella vectensis TaxID=45351 RepID=A7SD91_NEMVE|nr:uncharacterized protein LOC5509916 [Nematostella vectensis]EDO38343.1 predicted protein [Nematostella vectensis]|eukprot:XP_001630406.1 predicted protein [Nematostella vectensis]
MTFYMKKHSFFDSKRIPSSIAELERYKSFFTNLNETSHSGISIKKAKIGQSPDSIRSLASCSSFSFTDEVSSNASSSFSSEEESPGFKRFPGKISSFFEHTKRILKTPQKTPQKRTSPRKPLKPMKSVNRSDPDFRGVTLQMKTTVKKDAKDEKPKAQLVIDCCYSAKKRRSAESRERKRSRSTSPRINPVLYKLNSSPSYFSGEVTFDHELGVAPLNIEKECASCGVAKTPLWRDAEDGTPLCNACGIRYKKYRIRCLRCWYIPKKEEKALPCCPCCGHTFRVTLTRKGSTTSISE